ncbi:S1 family peptidase [Zooshikella harenae]|uniref:Trypsin-like peptidase domain-containing protein n=1 Tax=Zooshikella harenae TaxID=2827238 RepID=A0ABS5Z9E2_9GAMM|nr:serine protease [Zooshikella harenae]MBU2709936.1 trypsin-like peptidase domain-containing protein [Zooshikella harenae]
MNGIFLQLQRTAFVVLAYFLLGISQLSYGAHFPDVVAKVKPSIVGVGTYNVTASPAAQLIATGFVVHDGYHVVTNAHAIPEIYSAKYQGKRKLVIFVGQGRRPELREARVLQKDTDHDLVLLRIKGARLPALTLGQAKQAREGESIAFTGYPIGAVLGLYPVTHQGIISSVTPIVIPAANARQLDIQQIKRLRHPYNVLQLDATAYPGNSGSPVYLRQSGKVVGVINKVFVKETKESVLQKPSGITYAIPVNHVKNLISKLTKK